MLSLLKSLRLHSPRLCHIAVLLIQTNVPPMLECFLDGSDFPSPPFSFPTSPLELAHLFSLAENRKDGPSLRSAGFAYSLIKARREGGLGLQALQEA